MSGSLGSLVVEISGNIAKLTEATTKAQYQTQKMADKIGRDVSSINSHFDRMGAMVTRVTGLIGAIGGVGAFTGFIKSAIDSADELGKMAQKVGLTVEELSALKYAGSLADVSLEQLGVGVKQLSKNLVEAASGSKEQKAAFKALDIEIRNTEGAIKSSNELILEVADRFSKLEDGAAKTAIAMKLFGRSGADLIPLLNEGADGLEEMRTEAERLGVVVSEKTAKSAEVFNDNLTRLTANAKGFGFSVAEYVLPTLVQLSEELNNLAQKQNPLEKFLSFAKLSAEISAKATFLGPFIKPVSRILSWEKSLIFGEEPEQTPPRVGPVKTPEPKKSSSSALDNYLKSLDATEKKVTSKARSISKAVKSVTDSFVMENELALWGKKVNESLKVDREKADEDATWITNQRTTYAQAIAEMITKENAFQEAVIRRNISLSESARAFGEIGKVDALTQQIALYNDLMDNLEAKQGLVKAQSIEWMNVQTEIDNTAAKLTELGLALRDQTGSMNEGLNEGLRLYLENVNSTFQNGVQLAQETAANMERAFSDLFFDTITGEFDDLGDVIVGFLENVLRSLTNVMGQMTTSAITSGVKSLFNSGPDFSWLESAHGNVVSGPGISAFSNSIVSRPTVFPFARGIGLMGEAGSEAILPLTRIGGDLGVKAQMASPNIEVVLNVENKTGQEVKAKDNGGSFDGKRWVRNITLELLQTDPGFRGALKGI